MPESDRLRLPESIKNDLIGHALDCAPLEGCGLLAADGAGSIRKFYPIRNIDESAARFTFDPTGHFEAITDAEERGWYVFGVMHSHIRAPACPSEMDRAQPHDPEWVHIIVGLEPQPHVRAWRIVDGEATEVPIA